MKCAVVNSIHPWWMDARSTVASIRECPFSGCLSLVFQHACCTYCLLYKSVCADKVVISSNTTSCTCTKSKTHFILSSIIHDQCAEVGAGQTYPASLMYSVKSL